MCLEEIRIRPLLYAPMAGSGACLSGEGWGGAISEGDRGKEGVGVRVEVHERKMKLK